MEPNQFLNHDPILDVNPTSLEQPVHVKAEEIFLWDAFRKGSGEAFEVIYKRYANAMYNYGMHLFMDKVLVEDSMQDVFVELWKRKEFLGGTDSIKFYLLKSLKRKVLRRMATNKKWEHQILSGDFQVASQESAENQLVADQFSAAILETVKKAISDLPDRQREIIELRFYSNRSPQEISKSMKLSIDSTYTLLSRAIRQLRKNLRKM